LPLKVVAPIQTETCFKCKGTFPLEMFMKSTNKCKSCKAEENLAYRLKNRQSLKEIPDRKFCSHCTKVKSSCEFHKSSSNKDGLQYHCKQCSKILSNYKSDAKYRKALKQATPPWITPKHREQIEQIKQLARDMSIDGGVQYQVDHIEALQADDRCGLNVPWNLQIITQSENASKGNKSGLINGELQ